MMSPSGGKKAKTEKATSTKAITQGRLTVREERQSGTVGNKTLFRYLASFGGCGFWTAIITLQTVFVCTQVFGQLWMGFWTEDRFKSLSDKPPIFFIGIYAASMVVGTVIVLMRELTWRHGAVNAPRRIYDTMMNCVLHAPMSFFDTTPVGRIINRFTKDADQLDFAVPMAANQTMSLLFMQMGSMVAVCVLMPWFTPVAVVVAVILVFIQPGVETVVIRRLSNATQGPVAAMFSEVVGGSQSIRVLGLSEFFSKRFSRLLNHANGAKYFDAILFEAIRTRIDVIMGVYLFCAMSIITLLRNDINVMYATYIISQCIQVSMYMGYMMFQRGQLTLALNSIERLMEYCHVPSETEGSQTPDPNWPTAGKIELSNLTAQYRPGLPKVLKNVSVAIEGGMKVGVCGRTGSGKSSLLLTVFRLIPFLEGSTLKIDGIDTSELRLEALRSRLSAIPQEPVLFAGTVRDNLDPFKEQPEQVLLNALEMCHLKEALLKNQKDSNQNILDMKIVDGDLSVGQKQLMCMARAVARNSKILVLDEATSSVDVHTDQLIQATIREVFAKCTVITVAHRINTIIDSDRILVLDNGEVAEFGKPQELLENEESLFASLVAETEQQDENPQS